MDILRVCGISKKSSWGIAAENLIVLKNINFSIGSNEITGLIGPDGAGKTTLLKVIAGMIYPDQGTIFIDGYDLYVERDKALSAIGTMIEPPEMRTYLTGKDYLNGTRILRKVPCENVERVIDFIGISDIINDTIKRYSSWMKMKLSLGTCLLTSPKLLILDEPFKELSLSDIHELKKLLKNVSREGRISVLLTSNALGMVEDICTKVIFMKEGAIVSGRGQGGMCESSTEGRLV